MSAFAPAPATCRHAGALFGAPGPLPVATAGARGAGVGRCSEWFAPFATTVTAVPKDEPLAAAHAPATEVHRQQGSHRSHRPARAEALPEIQRRPGQSRCSIPTPFTYGCGAVRSHRRAPQRGMRLVALLAVVI